MKMKHIAPFCIAALVVLSCKKENNQSTFHLRMTDAPAAVEEVNIQLKEVRVKLDNDTAAWHTLQTNAGIYNLLQLQNGVDSLIAQGSFTSDLSVKEIRLIVGDSNTVKANGQIYPLTIPSGSESGLKIKVNKKLSSTLETLVIDFDAALSIKEETDGYKLRPVIKVK